MNVGHQKCAYVVKGESYKVCHRCFAHLAPDYINFLSKEYVNSAKFVSDETKFCFSCTEGNEQRNSFPVEGSRVSNVLDVFHSNVYGPMEVRSLQW